MKRLPLSLCAIPFVLFGCGGGGGAPTPGQTMVATGGAATVDATGGTSAATTTGGTVSIIIEETGGDPSLGDGTPEVCDGIDNDSNGVIDDVDVGHDGICDCLVIGTIGHIGPWSDGGDLFANWISTRSPLGAVALEDQELTPDLLRPFQILVVLYVDVVDAESTSGVITPAHHAFTDAEAAAFQEWVANGGGVMTTIGYMGTETTEVVNVNRLLNPLGLGYSSTKVNLDGYVERWEQHPVTYGVSRIFTADGTEPDGLGTDGLGAGVTTLAWDNRDRVALQVGEFGAGRIVVWGDEWLTYDSEWVDITDQQVELFWLNIFKWLSPPDLCQVPIPEILH